MDVMILALIQQAYDRREREAFAKLKEWETNPPPSEDSEGGPTAMVIGHPLVSLPLEQHRQLVAAAAIKPEDGDSERKKLADLQRGARRGHGAEVAIHLHDLKFLLERVPREDVH